jgi:carbonic anhydrase/acetyltransferase-like protein (isoleucine patch superfamily)
MPIENFERYTPRIHADAFVHPGAWVIGDVEVAERATVWPGAVLRGDHGAIRIGARTSIQDGTVAHATVDDSQTRVAEECTVGHRVILHGSRVAHHRAQEVPTALVHPGSARPPRSGSDGRGDRMDRLLVPVLSRARR